MLSNMNPFMHKRILIVCGAAELASDPLAFQVTAKFRNLVKILRYLDLGD